jgi:hypothetical protein
MKTLRNREIAQKFNTGWEVVTVKGVELIRKQIEVAYTRALYRSHLTPSIVISLKLHTQDPAA